MSNKELYGEVGTNVRLINKMLDLIPEEEYKNPNNKWLDPGAGKGNFAKALYDRLIFNFPSDYILKNMIYMIEINPKNIKILREKFGEEANIISGDFLSWNPKFEFDIIIGNPPYNSGGKIKVPTNKKLNKRRDGSTIWHKFVRHSISLLKKGGILVMIIPSLWLRKDKAGMNEYILRYQVENVHCFTNTETNRLFHGKAQTPTCYFILRKQNTNGIISLYDKEKGEKIEFMARAPLPVNSISVIKKLLPFVEEVGNLKVIKTNMPRKNVLLSRTSSIAFSYKNIRTCVVHNKTSPILKFEYSNEPLIYYGKRKLVLAHKMYGIPYYDESGEYGISNRDNYVILGKGGELRKWREFLSTKVALYIFRSTRYRMMFLEREAFEYIPNIMKLKNFPLEEMTEEKIMEYFGFDEEECKNIQGERSFERIKVN